MEEETEELKKHLQIVTDDDDDVYTDATPLASKIPIVDYKIHTERNRPYFKIIKADGNHMLFISFSTMLKNFDREDLESLWKIKRDRFKKTKPKNYLDEYLLNTLKIMFEKPNVEAVVDTQLSTRLEDSIQKAFRSYTVEFKKKSKDEKKRYIHLVKKSMKEIIKDEVKNQLPQILPKEVSDYATPVIQSTITESLENVVLAKSFSQPKSTYKAAASLIEFVLKKILLDKM
uniref:Uncharacterized protein n=1 Tax=Tanacetum cinerariifolium TaxID=118510 RepID=A0A6L2KS41_TANCI|nr:hypothetical protein [Tanacetum cinerariifolium]